MPHMKRKAQRKRRLLFLFSFLVCMGFGIGYIMMDSNKSINVVSKFQEQQKIETDGGVASSHGESGVVTRGTGDSKAESSFGKAGYSEKAWIEAQKQVMKKPEPKAKDSLEEILIEVNEQANKAINDLQEAINTDDDNDTSDEEGGIGKLFTDWWWILVALYFFRGIFTSGS